MTDPRPGSRVSDKIRAPPKRSDQIQDGCATSKVRECAVAGRIPDSRYLLGERLLSRAPTRQQQRWSPPPPRPSVPVVGGRESQDGQDDLIMFAPTGQPASRVFASCRRRRRRGQFSPEQNELPQLELFPVPVGVKVRVRVRVRVASLSPTREPRHCS